MLKPDKRCKVCQLIKTDKRLLQRIYDSKAFVKGGESLRAISREYEGHFEYQSLYNHARAHQGLSAEDVESKQLAKRARAIEAEQLRGVIKHTDLRDELLSTGMEGIREGDIRLKASDVVSLLKQKADIEAKQKDQDLAMARYIQDYASGAIVDIIAPGIEEGDISAT